MVNRYENEWTMDTTNKNGEFESSNSCHVQIILESGSSDHIVRESQFLSKFEKFPIVQKLTCANSDHNSDLKIIGKGVVCFTMYVENNIKAFELEDTLYIPQLSENLMSVRKITQKGYNVLFTNAFGYIVKRQTGELMAKAEYDGNFWRMNIFPSLDPSNTRTAYVTQTCVEENGTQESSGIYKAMDLSAS